MKAAIHQPNFFPWLGYFNKIKSVDLFVFFDNVQRQQGKSWISRVKVANNENEVWLTIPLQKSGNSIQRIHESRISEPKLFKKDLFNKIQNYYRKAPFTKEVLLFLDLYWPNTDSISIFNGKFTELISNRIGFNTKFVYCSHNNNLVFNEKTGNEIILDVCKEFEINDYLSGSGCLDFFKPEFLEKNSIKVSFQTLDFIEYPQEGKNSFNKGMSILDLLVNVGFDKASSYI
jgi:hypothetical protein